MQKKPLKKAGDLVLKDGGEREEKKFKVVLWHNILASGNSLGAA